jgi:hypothetical protein
MQNKKVYIIFTVVVVLVAAAAFIGGRLLTGQAGPLGIFPMMGGGDRVSISIEMVPAPELPQTEPETRGFFVERKDNTVILQEFSMEMGKGGVVVSAGPGERGGPMISGGSGGDGPRVEVVVTNDTIIYRDATEMVPPSELSGTTTIQQEVEEGTLDDLTGDTMLMVWGRKNGDRIIADVIVYSQPFIFKKGTP